MKEPTRIEIVDSFHLGGKVAEVTVTVATAATARTTKFRAPRAKLDAMAMTSAMLHGVAVKPPKLKKATKPDAARNRKRQAKASRRKNRRK